MAKQTIWVVHSQPHQIMSLCSNGWCALLSRMNILIITNKLWVLYTLQTLKMNGLFIIQFLFTFLAANTTESGLTVRWQRKRNTLQLNKTHSNRQQFIIWQLHFVKLGQAKSLMLYWAEKKCYSSSAKQKQTWWTEVLCPEQNVREWELLPHLYPLRPRSAADWQCMSTSGGCSVT